MCAPELLQALYEGAVGVAVLKFQRVDVTPRTCRSISAARVSRITGLEDLVDAGCVFVEVEPIVPHDFQTSEDLLLSRPHESSRCR